MSFKHFHFYCGTQETLTVNKYNLVIIKKEISIYFFCRRSPNAIRCRRRNACSCRICKPVPACHWCCCFLSPLFKLWTESSKTYSFKEIKSVTRAAPDRFFQVSFQMMISVINVSLFLVTVTFCVTAADAISKVADLTNCLSNGL